MGDSNKQASLASRAWGASQSGNPDVHSSLTRDKPNIGERALVSGYFGAGSSLEQLAKLARES